MYAHILLRGLSKENVTKLRHDSCRLQIVRDNHVKTEHQKPTVYGSVSKMQHQQQISQHLMKSYNAKTVWITSKIAAITMKTSNVLIHKIVYTVGPVCLYRSQGIKYTFNVSTFHIRKLWTHNP